MCIFLIIISIDIYNDVLSRSLKTNLFESKIQQTVEVLKLCLQKRNSTETLKKKEKNFQLLSSYAVLFQCACRLLLAH